MVIGRLGNLSCACAGLPVRHNRISRPGMNARMGISSNFRSPRRAAILSHSADGSIMTTDDLALFVRLLYVGSPVGLQLTRPSQAHPRRKPMTQRESDGVAATAGSKSS